MVPSSHYCFRHMFSLGENQISDGGHQLCVHALNAKYKTSIMCEFCLIFSLSDNEMTDDGGVVLGEMLKMNESLKELK